MNDVHHHHRGQLNPQVNVDDEALARDELNGKMKADGIIVTLYQLTLVVVYELQ